MEFAPPRPCGQTALGELTTPTAIRMASPTTMTGIVH